MDIVSGHDRIQRILYFYAGYVIVRLRVTDFNVSRLAYVDTCVGCSRHDNILDNNAGAAYRVDAVSSGVIDDQVTKDDSVGVLNRDPVPGIVPDLKTLNMKIVPGSDDGVRQLSLTIQDRHG